MARAGFVLVALVIASLAGVEARAATFVVDTTTDAVDVNPGDGVCATAGGACALRAAVQETNALAGADDITLPAGLYTLTIYGAAEDLGASGDLDVHDTLTITGAGAASTTINGNDRVRVIEAGVPFPTSPFTTLTLTALRIFGGEAEPFDDCNGIIALPGGDGVCANTVGLTIADAIVEANQNGILAVGSLMLTRSTIQLNGLGAQVVAGPTLITDSTVHHNLLGLRLDPGAGATIRNSTIIANNATGIDVGGACEPPQIPCPSNGLSLENVTIVGHANEGVYARMTVYPTGGTASVPVSVRNSIIVGNTHACEGELTSGGYNLLKLGTDCVVGGDTTGNVLVTTSPEFEALAVNGGSTATLAPSAGNPAINGGNPAVPGSGGNACPATDQRGVARPIGAGCDMGAFETSCGDGILDAAEVCETGVCCNVHCGPDDGLCPACLVCDGGTACGEPPPDACTPPITSKSTLKVIANADPAKRAVGWKWRGAAVTGEFQFGALTTPGGPEHHVCLYAGGAPFLLLDADAGCSGGLCWTARPNGFQLKSDASALGKVRVTLRDGKNNSVPDLLDVKIKGTGVGLPTLPASLPVRMRLVRTDTGACWDATFDAGVSKNSPTQLRGKSD